VHHLPLQTLLAIHGDLEQFPDQSAGSVDEQESVVTQELNVGTVFFVEAGERISDHLLDEVVRGFSLFGEDLQTLDADLLVGMGAVTQLLKGDQVLQVWRKSELLNLMGLLLSTPHSGCVVARVGADLGSALRPFLVQREDVFEVDGGVPLNCHQTLLFASQHSGLSGECLDGDSLGCFEVEIALVDQTLVVVEAHDLE
jgi:hypothetical protein